MAISSPSQGVSQIKLTALKTDTRGTVFRTEFIDVHNGHHSMTYFRCYRKNNRRENNFNCAG